MEMYLKNDKHIFRFPILPSTINVQDYAIINDSNITGLGDVAIFGGKGLRTIEISSFFPNPKRKYKFVNYSNYPKQWDCVSKIRGYMNNGEVMRFIVTGTEINFQARITDFTFSQQDGTGDVYYTINLKEYREIKISSTTPAKKKTDNKNRTSSKDKNNNKNKTSTKSKQTIHTVKKGDTLYDIAKKYYGKGSSYKKIIEKNKSKYPSLTKNTIIKAGWKLVI
ncbi:MAG: LysM peptidoglycan-binding domain-containing protein [Terrisporobacter sp.]|uniref:LysM peptidoglycan-binding domain-containing protein n=1 Tax=Terrisporobacter sp. TaxID=1965305 RepID=UPI00205B96F7|nr:MAG TPA: tail assembly protein [Caudoviricetes sp.]